VPSSGPAGICPRRGVQPLMDVEGIVLTAGSGSREAQPSTGLGDLPAELLGGLDPLGDDDGDVAERFPCRWLGRLAAGQLGDVRRLLAPSSRARGASAGDLAGRNAPASPAARRRRVPCRCRGCVYVTLRRQFLGNDPRAWPCPGNPYSCRMVIFPIATVMQSNTP
jgi:hypothetical protein